MSLFAERMRAYKDTLQPDFEVSNVRCCGIKEIHGIENHIDPWFVLFSAALSKRLRCTNVIFSHTGNFKIGHSLAELIHELKLGEVFVLPTTINPNSGHKLTMFVWQIEQTAWRNFGRRTCAAI